MSDYPEIVRALLLSPSTATTFASMSRRWLVELAAVAELKVAPPGGQVLQAMVAPPGVADGLLIGQTGRIDAHVVGPPGVLAISSIPAGQVVVVSTRDFLRPPLPGGGAALPGILALVSPLIGPATVHAGARYWWIDTVRAADLYYRAFRAT